LYLTAEEKAMLSGEYGPGIKRCMEILVKVGKASGADRMVRINSAHVMPKEPPDLLAELTEGVSDLGVSFCSQHALMSAFDPEHWEAMGVPRSYALEELKLRDQRLDIYKRVGFYQTNTCLPMLVGNLPLTGDHVSWIGSCAQILVNSILGARTNRDGTVVNLASAITGCTPYVGLHLDENRYAKVVVEFEDEIDTENLTHADLGAIGYYVGRIAGNRNVAFNGLPETLDIDQMKYLMAPLSTSGSVSICHILGLTPEASTLEEATGGNEPEEVILISKKNIEDTKAIYDLQDNEEVDLVILGCPHVTIQEMRTISQMIEGRVVQQGKRLWLGMPYMVYELAKEMGYSQAVEEAGGIVSSSCMACIPDCPLPEDTKVVATNSFKAAHYVYALTKGKVKAVIRNTEDCLGLVCRDA
jgi:predicted aconitase